MGRNKSAQTLHLIRPPRAQVGRTQQDQQGACPNMTSCIDQTMLMLVYKQNYEYLPFLPYLILAAILSWK